MKRDAGLLRISELQMAILGLPDWERCAPREREIAIAELLTNDLYRHRRPDWEEVDDDIEIVEVCDD